MIDPEKEIIILRETFLTFVENTRWLKCLKDAGVDSWEGCEVAQEIYQKRYGEEDDDN